MARRKPQVVELTHGLYEGFDDDCDEMPRLVTGGTTQVPARVGQEFGYTLQIKQARGLLIAFEIDHPGIPDESGVARPPFTGEQYVRTSDYQFYLGDALWEPMDHMLGPWALTTWLDGEQIARRTFIVTRVGVDWDDELGEQ